MDADTLLKLSVYEHRLLKQFQAERRARFDLEKYDAIKIRKIHKQQNRPFYPAQFGFVSTLPQIERFIRKTRAMEGRLDPESSSETRENG